ncbi:unnamed protein product [Lupinus luteus]|uniref:Uncharacterized protein n=1 Tax=Lupinus luteus TaxID=3873 RepID=A0AAV1Y166_LUPLU
MDTLSSSSSSVDEYSASSTLITFHTPIPLLRGPLPSGLSESAPYALAFRDPHSWANSYRSSLRNIVKQCEEGARIGCAISASSNCKPPWWNLLLGSKAEDLKERERCEEREMNQCFVLAKEKCVEFAKAKCSVPFRDARIKGLGFKDGLRFLNLASINNPTLFMITPPHTNCRASELLGFDDYVECILGEGGEGAHD